MASDEVYAKLAKISAGELGLFEEANNIMLAAAASEIAAANAVETPETEAESPRAGAAGQ